MGDSMAETPPSYRVISHRWGAVVHSTLSGQPSVVYWAPSTRLASYVARVEFATRRGPVQTWEEAFVGLGALLTFFVITMSIYPSAWSVFASLFGALFVVFGARRLARRTVIARRLSKGTAVGQLIRTSNDELIEMALPVVIQVDHNPEGAAALVAELDDAWRRATSSTAHEKGSILAALRATASAFPTTDEAVAQVRSELLGVRRSLAALESAQRELDAAISTQGLSDPAPPPASLGLLRAAAESVAQDAQVVREVAREQGSST